jgi:hypothetical protein
MTINQTILSLTTAILISVAIVVTYASNLAGGIRI